VNCLVDKELVRRSQPEGSGQRLDVHMDGNDKWCPSGVRTGTSVFNTGEWSQLRRGA